MSLIILIVICFFAFADRWRYDIKYSFPGSQEKLEDALLASGLEFTEVKPKPDTAMAYGGKTSVPSEMTFSDRTQAGYKFRVERQDSLIDFLVNFGDCRSIYSLVRWGDDNGCDSASLRVESYDHNLEHLSLAVADQIFYQEIVTKVQEAHDQLDYDYRVAKKSYGSDTLAIYLLTESKKIRRRYLYVRNRDGIKSPMYKAQEMNFWGDSIHIYTYDRQGNFLMSSSAYARKALLD